MRPWTSWSSSTEPWLTILWLKHLGSDGIVLTKFDTIDDKVGAAISMTYITSKPIVLWALARPTVTYAASMPRLWWLPS